MRQDQDGCRETGGWRSRWIGKRGVSTWLQRVLRQAAAVRVAFLIAAALSCPAVGDIEAQETRVITLEHAVETALKSNASILLAENLVLASRISADQARKELYPDLTASISASRDYSKGSNMAGQASDYEAGDALSARLASSLTLFDGLGTVNSIRKSDLDLSASISTYQHVKASLVFMTFSAYVEVLANQEIVESQQQNLEAQRQQLTLVEEFERAGNRSLADVLQQRATAAQAELQLIEAEHQASLSKLQLAETMGLDPTSEYEIVQIPTEDMMDAFSAGSGDETVSRALVARADVAAQREQVEVASRAVAIAGAGYWPSLSLNLGAASSYSSMNEYSGFSDQLLEENPNLQVGLSISVPIFDRSRTGSSVQQARLALKNEEINLTDLERQVALEVRQAFFDYETAVKRLDVAETQLDYAAEALEATSARYRVGSSTLVEVTTSNAQYVEARNEKVRAEYTLLLSMAALSYYSGEMDETLPFLDLSQAERPSPSEG